MIYKELSQRSGDERLSAIEQRNKELLSLGKRTGEAIVSGLPHLYAFRNDWETLTPAVLEKLDHLTDVITTYCNFIDPPDRLGNQSHSLSHLTRTVRLNLHPDQSLDDQTRAYLERDRPARLRQVLDEYGTLITETFALPEMDESTAGKLIDAPVSHGMDWANAPKGLEGLRFIPGYAMFDWGHKDDKAGELLVVYRDDIPLDIMQIKKKDGREFFITATGGLFSLDYLLRSVPPGEKISIIGAVSEGKKNRKTNKPAVVVDRDGTIAHEGIRWDTDPDDIKEARAAFFQALSKSGVPSIIWSKNDSVPYMVRILSESLGIPFALPITYNNWPFFNRESDSRQLDHEQLSQILQLLPQDLHDTVATYVRDNFGFGENQPLDAFLSILHDRITRYWEEKIANYKEEYARYWDSLYEARAPLFVGLTQDQFSNEDRANFIRDGVLVNNNFASIDGARVFGYNFIHVGHPSHIDRVIDILSLLYTL